MSGFKELTCEKCGGKLKEKNGIYVCVNCKTEWKETEFSKEQQLANLRRQLYVKLNEKNTDSAEIRRLCQKIKDLNDYDLYGNFFLAANTEPLDKNAINACLESIDPENGDEKGLLCDIIEFIIKSPNVLNICHYGVIISLLRRAYGEGSREWNKYYPEIAEKQEENDKGVFNVNVPRDVFVAYSSKDESKVIKIVDYLEKNGRKCFYSLRNQHHGSGAVSNYEKNLEKAIDSCKVFLFISSENSRNQNCDALTKEIEYVKRKDRQNAQGYGQGSYEQIPQKFKKPRIEFLIDKYAKNNDNPGEDVAKEFFGGCEWVTDSKELCRRVYKLINEKTPDEEERKREEENLRLKKQLAEAQLKAEKIKQAQINREKKQQQKAEKKSFAKENRAIRAEKFKIGLKNGWLGYQWIAAVIIAAAIGFGYYAIAKNFNLSTDFYWCFLPAVILAINAVLLKCLKKGCSVISFFVSAATISFCVFTAFKSFERADDALGRLFAFISVESGAAGVFIAIAAAAIYCDYSLYYCGDYSLYYDGRTYKPWRFYQWVVGVAVAVALGYVYLVISKNYVLPKDFGWSFLFLAIVIANAVLLRCGDEWSDDINSNAYSAISICVSVVNLAFFTFTFVNAAMHPEVMIATNGVVEFGASVGFTILGYSVYEMVVTAITSMVVGVTDIDDEGWTVYVGISCAPFIIAFIIALLNGGLSCS